MFESTIIFKVLYYTKTPVKMCKPKHRLGSFISISIGLQEVLNTSLDHCFISFINICIGLQEVLQGQLGCKIAEAQNRKDWEGSSYNKYCIIIIIAVNTIWTSFNNINSIQYFVSCFVRLSLNTDVVVHILLWLWIKWQIATGGFWGWADETKLRLCWTVSFSNSRGLPCLLFAVLRIRLWARKLINTLISHSLTNILS